jgi:hypothetical protein
MRIVPLHGINRDGTCSCGTKCHPKHVGKHPRLKAWQHKATTDPNTIQDWCKKWPGSNIGIATGKGLIVLDVDVDAGGCESLQELEHKHGELPRTPLVRTGSGGWHYYFRVPDGLHVNNSGGKIAPGLDVRGDGGQVVAPPSKHYSGQRYDWMRHPSVVDLADCPQWLLDAIQAHPGTKERSQKPKEKRATPLPTTPRSGDVLTDIIQRFPIDGPGTRYHAMVRAVGSLVGRGRSEQDVLALINAWLDHYEGQYESDRDRCQAQLEQCLRSTLNSDSFILADGYNPDYPLRELTAVQQQFLDATLDEGVVTIPDGGAYAVYHPLHVRDGSNVPSALLDMKRTGLLARGSTQKAFIDAWLCVVLHNLLDTGHDRVVATDKQVIELMKSKSGIDIDPHSYYRLKHDYVTRWKADKDGHPTDELQPARKCELLVEVVKGQRVGGGSLWPSEYDLSAFGWLLESEFNYPYWLEVDDFCDSDIEHASAAAWVAAADRRS